MEQIKSYPFLTSSGEMARLIQACDWHKTPVGPIEQWPQSLKTALSIILESAFPMLLFWGEELIAFYNDPYTKILETDNRHPAVGKKASQIWPEGWDTVKPLLDKAYNGESVHFEDLMIPVYRNGELEEVYWTFKYSPFYGDNEKIAGVIVSCAETTDSVKNYKQLQENKEELEFAIEATELGTWELNPKYQTIKVNNRVKEWFGLMSHEEVSLSTAANNIIDEDRERVTNAINYALQYESGGQYDIEYTIENPLTKERRIVRAKGRSWFNEDKVAYRFAGTLQDITEQAKAAEVIKENQRQLIALFEQSPVGIASIAKNDLTFTTANAFYGKLVDRQVSEILNKPLLVALPEIKGQGFDKLLYGVIETGIPYIAKEVEVNIKRGSGTENIYVDLAYQPILEKDESISGVFVVATDVTEQVYSRRKVERSEQRFRNLVEQAVVSTAILTGPDMILELANEAMLKVWGRNESVIGKPLLEFMPELKDQMFPKILSEVYKTGEQFVAEGALAKLERNGKLEEVYMDFSYKTLNDDNADIKSILVMATDVTERVLTNKRLQQSEENLRNTILKAPVAMAIFKGENFVTEIANERMLYLWGKSEEEVLGRPTFDAMPEIRDQGFDDVLNNVYANGEAYSANGRPVKIVRNGQLDLVYLNFVFEAYRDLNGVITGIIVVALDVTEQVQSSHKVEESEQRVRALVQSAPFPIGVYTGREMRIELANQTILDIWGKGNDVIGKLYTEILPELENQEIFQQLEQVYDTGVAFHARNQRVDIVVDGKLQPFWFNYSFTPLYDREGKVYGVMNTAAEVTDLNLAKQKVEQSEKNFRNMILQAPVAMCILIGPDHVVDIANDSMIELWGKKRKDVMDKPIFEALPDAAEQGLEQLLDHAYSHGETFSAFERPVELLRNGKYEVVYQNFVYQPYRDSNGDVLGVLAISIDVTEQVKARREIEVIVQERTTELEQANVNLEQSNAALEQFAYITSHDLQEPVRKISIFSKMLESSFTDLDERQSGYITKIKSASERMSNLIKDVLLYSRVSKGGDTFERVDLTHIVKDTVSDYELLIEQSSATIKYEDLPVVEAIPLQMVQLFSNLISNSLKYVAPGVDPQITITCSKADLKEIESFAGLNPEKQYYEIRFMDNGIGFEPEYAEKIFNIFQRLHTKSEYSGTGVGLAICKKIMENHHGDITAAPRPEGGAMFKIIIPE